MTCAWYRTMLRRWLHRLLDQLPERGFRGDHFTRPQSTGRDCDFDGWGQAHPRTPRSF